MKTFNDWYEIAKVYYNHHGNLDVPFDYVSEDGSRLGIWITKIKGVHKGIASYAGRLSPQQAKMLEEIGIVWNEDNFEENYEIENCKTKEDFKHHRELYHEGAFKEISLFDAVLDLYDENISIYAIAKKYGVSTKAVRKILLTAGLYSSDKSEKIWRLLEEGFSLEEISQTLKLSASTINSYLPLYAPWGRSASHTISSVEVEDKPSEAERLTSDLVEEISDDYLSGYSIYELQKNYGFSKRKVIKLLVTSGVYSTDRSREINRLHESGKTAAQIADILNITLSAVNTYLPYESSAYNTGATTENIIHSKSYRERKKAKDKLLRSSGLKTYPKMVWKNILLFEGSPVKLKEYNVYYKVYKSKVVFNDGIVFDRHQIEEMIYGNDYPEHLTGLFELIGVKKPAD